MQSWLKKISGIFIQFKKKNQEKIELVIPNRQVNWLIAAVFSTSLFCFFLGYFWGYRCALERFVAKIEEESFADRISYALYTMNDRDISEFESEQEDSNGAGLSDDESVPSDEQEEVEETMEVSVPIEDEPTKIAEIVSDAVVEKNHLEANIHNASLNQAKKEVVFIAPLAGFGTLQAATHFLQRVKLLDPQALLEEKVSSTAKGKKVTWYQVKTGEFETKDKLKKVVDMLQKKEHIKNVQIIEKRKG